MGIQPIEPILRANLFRLARAYVAATGVNLSTVSRYAINDARTLARLRDDEGSSITLRKYDEAVRWFTTHWPNGRRLPPITDPTHQRKPRAARHPAPVAPAQQQPAGA